MNSVPTSSCMVASNLSPCSPAVAIFHRSAGSAAVGYEIQYSKNSSPLRRTLNPPELDVSDQDDTQILSHVQSGLPVSQQIGPKQKPSKINPESVAYFSGPK